MQSSQIENPVSLPPQFTILVPLKMPDRLTELTG
jgi:hypothetical protein